MKNFKEQLNDKVQDIEEGIKRYLPKEEGYEKTIYQAMNYSVLAGGKRLRPMFMKEFYQLFGGKEESVIRPFMAAIEMIHTYSLVHDDLPAMDNDDYRRGRLTTHKVYGEDMGILAGDALLNAAFETAFLAFDTDCDAKRIGRALQVMGDKAGVHGMIGGQVVDVEFCGKDLDLPMITFIHHKKTCALIELSMMVGAILGGATPEQVGEVEKVGRDVGLAFQIQDDILDIVGDEAVLGKPVHSDEKNEKTTYATLVGLDNARADVKSYSEDAIDILRKIPGDSEFLQQLIESLINRDK